MSEHDDQANVFAGHLASLSTLVAPMQEATLGYRQRLIDAGMGKEAADLCAADYHAWLMSMLPTNQPRKSRR